MRKLLAILAGLLLFLAACQPMNTNQEHVYNMINQSRNDHWIHSLFDDYTARSKAQSWSEHMSREGRLSHSNLESGMEGVSWTKIGENVGRGGSLGAIHRGFLESPSHKANMLDPEFTHVGTGVTWDAAEGVYYVSQVYYRHG